MNRARLICIFISFCLCSAAEGAAKKVYRAAIVTARDYLVQRDRKSAAAVILNEMQQEKNSKNLQELKSEMNRINTLFITDKGQRAFETAEVIRFSGDSDALEKYEEVYKTEGDNTFVLQAIALMRLQRGECAKAAIAINKIIFLDPDAEESKYLQLRLRACDEPGTLTAEDKAILLQLNRLKLFGYTLLANNALIRAQPEVYAEMAWAAFNADGNYPTGAYLVSKIKREKEEMGEEFAQKFIALCAGLTPSSRRTYQWDTELCKEKVAVEKSLKKLGSQKNENL